MKMNCGPIKYLYFKLPFSFRIELKLFNYILEVSNGALRPWSYFKIHRHSLYKHLVWGRLSISFGQPHLEEIGLCAVCGSTEIGEQQAGDEGWTVCDDCGSVEQGYEYITVEEAEKRGVI